MKALLCVVGLLFVAACGGGGDVVVNMPPASGPSVALVEYRCADVVNNSANNRCDKTASLFMRAAYAIDVDAGRVSRGQLVTSIQDVANVSPVDFDGWVKAEFDAGCGGAATWEILPLQRIRVVAGDTLRLSVSGTCGDMPLGPRVLTGTAYMGDAITPIDRVRVLFDLTN